MEPIKVSRTADSLAQTYFNGNQVSAIYFNGTLIWPASYTPELNHNIDEPGEIDYNEFEELL